MTKVPKLKKNGEPDKRVTNTNTRPTIYTKELGDIICKRIAEGESVRQLCYDKKMPAQSTIYEWLLDENKKEFSENYTRARASQAEVLFDEMLEIADDGSNDLMTVWRGKEKVTKEDTEVTNRSKLRVDTRKWYLSKVLPKKFGDKVDVMSGGEKVQGVTVIFKNFGDGTPSE